MATKKPAEGRQQHTLRRTDAEKKNPAKAGRGRKTKEGKATKTTPGRDRWKEVETEKRVDDRPS